MTRKPGGSGNGRARTDPAPRPKLVLLGMELRPRLLIHAPGAACEGCGRKPEGDGMFCAHCGRPLGEVRAVAPIPVSADDWPTFATDRWPGLFEEARMAIEEGERSG